MRPRRLRVSSGDGPAAALAPRGVIGVRSHGLFGFMPDTSIALKLRPTPGSDFHFASGDVGHRRITGLTSLISPGADRRFRYAAGRWWGAGARHSVTAQNGCWGGRSFLLGLLPPTAAWRWASCAHPRCFGPYGRSASIGGATKVWKSNQLRLPGLVLAQFYGKRCLTTWLRGPPRLKVCQR